MSAAQLRSMTILLVDPDALTRELTAQMLGLGGFDVLSAPNGERALLMIRAERERIGWLVTRDELPGLTCGRILADEYRTYHPARPALITGARAAGRSESAVRMEATAPMDILEAVKALTAQALHAVELVAGPGEAEAFAEAA
jgi:CheY-like chemotaxis protein